MVTRINYILLLVGKRGCGKTTLGIEIARKTQKPIIVINTDNNDAYKDFEIIPLDKLYKWNGKEGICITDNVIEAVTILNKYHKNKFIIFDDSAKYISQTVEREFKNFIINHRMNNLDIIFMYHLLRFVPPYIASQFNKLVLFKTTDNNINDLKQRYGNYNAIDRNLSIIKNNKSPYFFKIINDTDD